MRNLFGSEGLKILESLSFTRALYAFDYDGTLSRIVRNPDDAFIHRSTNRLLLELLAHAPVAIVSGRSIKDLEKRLNFKPHYLIGNHGLEGFGSKANALLKAQRICRDWTMRLQEILSQDNRLDGLEIENKSYSIALHYRKSTARKRAKLDIVAAAAELDPAPRIILGKCVVNLLPPCAPHKGVALMELKRESGVKSVFYIGDDDTDEDVFSLPNSGIFTVRVGKKAKSQAQYYISKQAEMDRLLKTILRFYRSTKLPRKKQRA